MSENVSRAPETLPLAIQKEVDVVCLRFVKELQDGKHPRIKDYLGEKPEPTRSALLAELLREELEYRSGKGDPPTEAEYCFEGQQEVVKQVFARLPKSVLPHVPGYKLLAEIGRGGMGVVFKAKQIQLPRTVALKMIRSGELADKSDRQRFKAEAEATAALQHPHIVRVHEIGEIDGCPYFSMDFIEGMSLAQRLAAGPVPGKLAAGYLVKIARAIQHAHDKKILHRDLKPANVLVDGQDQPHVTDFGLAKRLDHHTFKTQTGAVLGTPSYMAPEQADGSKELTPAVDVYGLGAILYELLTGRPPFRGENVPDTLLQVMHQLPVPPRLLNPEIDADLDTVCLKCLEKNPGERYATAEKVAKELDLYLNDEPIKARPPNWVQSLSRQIRKRREVLDPLSWSHVCLLGAAVIFCIHTAIFWMTQPGGPTFLFAPCIGLNVVLSALISWYYLLRRRQHFTPDEWHIFALHGYFVSTAFVLYATTFPWDRESILAIYPALALLSGLYNVVLARLYWGPLYFQGLVYYLLAFVMKLQPEWAPLEFALVCGGHALASGLLLRRFRKPWHG